MSTERDVSRIVRSWLEVGVSTLPDRVLDTVLDQLPATPQHRPWWPARRFPAMPSPAKVAIATAAIVVVVVAGVLLLPRSNSSIGGSSQTSPPPAATRPSPTSSGAPSPIGSRTTAVATLTAGGDTVQVQIDRPAGWISEGFAILKDDARPPRGMAVSLWTVQNLFSDPCTHTELVPAIGPTVDDLATALSKIPGTTAGKPTTATIAGRDALLVELVVDPTLDCPSASYYLWQAGPNDYRYIQAPGEANRIWVTMINGKRVLINAEYQAGATAADLAELQSIVDSIQIVP